MSNAKPVKVNLGILFFFLILVNSAIIVNAQEYEKVKFGTVVMTKMSWEDENKYMSEPEEDEKNLNIKLESVDSFIKSRGYKSTGKDTKTITELDNKLTNIKAKCTLYTYTNIEKAKTIVLTKAERTIILKADGKTTAKDTYDGKNYMLYVEVSEYKEIKMADI